MGLCVCVLLSDCQPTALFLLLFNSGVFMSCLPSYPDNGWLLADRCYLMFWSCSSSLLELRTTNCCCEYATGVLVFFNFFPFFPFFVFRFSFFFLFEVADGVLSRAGFPVSPGGRLSCSCSIFCMINACSWAVLVVCVVCLLALVWRCAVVVASRRLLLLGLLAALNEYYPPPLPLSRTQKRNPSGQGL